MKYGVIHYSQEHIHVVTKNEERCYLSRNWNRCTAGLNHKIKDADNLTRSYYDGNAWTKAPRPEKW